MNSSASTKGSEGSGIDLGFIKKGLPGLEEFTVAEQFGDSYTRYCAVHEASALPVWVHHFDEIDAELLARLEGSIERMKQL